MPQTHPDHPPSEPPNRLLITAGPTHEPIDAVRYIANRSSGRLGIALAEQAARRGWTVTLLLGPTTRTPADSRVTVHRFRTTADLQHLLQDTFLEADVLIMAAAVADFRPIPGPHGLKLRRTGEGLNLPLHPTPDLLAECAARRRPGQLLVGFALEPDDLLLPSAREKLARKGLDLIVANPVRTLDADDIEAVLLDASAGEPLAPGPMSKDRFAAWLLGQIESRVRRDPPGVRSGGLRA